MKKKAQNNLYLTGFMGCGKSTVGRVLAQRMRRPFLDTDGMIEQATGASVGDLFRTRGQAAFRAWESLIVEQVARQRGCVVALGGGALLAPINVARVVRSGVMVHLRASTPTLLERLSVDARPLLQDCPVAELPARLEQLRAEREPGYNLAIIAVCTDHRSVEQVADEILREVLGCDA
ncbi:MAG: shikimate kinase [Deltaproteobacteria bacterium]|nr:shikimate kinase [Deltaproteobacteria bacterium]